MTGCTRCESTGFLNFDQLPEEMKEAYDQTGDINPIMVWIGSHGDHDVSVCDCCGNGEYWYGERGSHYSSDDLPGKDGPYAYNGGLCECH